MRGSQQTVHDLFESARRFVSQKGLNLLRGGRQANEIEGGSPNQRPLVRRRGGGEPFLLQPGQNEIINRLPGPALVLHGGKRRIFDWLKRPELPSLLEVNRIRRRGVGGGSGVLRNRRTHFDPGLEIGYFREGKLMFGRHLQVLVCVAYCFDEQAFLGCAGHDGGSRVTAFEQPLAGVQTEIAFEFFGLGAVTFITALDQHRPDFFLKKLGALAARLRRRGREATRARNKQNSSPSECQPKYLVV